MLNIQTFHLVKLVYISLRYTNVIYFKIQPEIVRGKIVPPKNIGDNKTNLNHL